jgi:NAD(P)-dependent dehydrogenase (short-subunit alcohol dehydrogenase family)
MELVKDKVVVIAGAAGLLGKEFVNAVANHGGIPIQADLKVDKVPENKFDRYPLDITSGDSLLALINYCKEKYGRIDSFVNSAYPRGKNYGRKFEDVSYQDFCENINLHLGGYFLASQKFSVFFKSQGFGNIINVSSIYGVIAPRFSIYENTPMTMPVEYAAIKSALIHISKYMMRYYQGYKIRFNCITPGGIFDNQPESFLQQYKKFSQTKGMLDTSDLCGALLFLLSDLSEFVNGQNIIVDDGWTV